MLAETVRKQTGALLLATVGFALAVAVLLDASHDWLVQGAPLWPTVAGNVVPFAFSLAIPVTAQRLYVSDRNAAALATVTKWTALGLVAMLFVAAWLVGAQVVHVRSDPFTLGVQMAVFGSVAGLAIGCVVEQSRRRSDALRETQTRHDALVEAFPDYAFLYNTEGEYLDAILGWEREDGRTYAADDLIGATVHDVLSPETADTILDVVQEAAETGSIETVEYQIETARGNRWFEGRASPIDEPVDSEEAVIFAARDVTEQHELRRELESQNERLDRFASMVSHDLRNPLNVAMGHLQFIDAEEAEHVEKAQVALDRMEDIIEDTLVLARQGRTVSETETIEMAAIAPRCWETVATEKADLSVVEPFELRADADRLRHLLENLFRNAVQHGGTDVLVTIGPIDETGFYVADDGSGIPPADREDLFDAGYTTGAEGNGFGLTIVEEIAGAHGWRIDVSESESGGARFEFTGVEDVRRTD